MGCKQLWDWKIIGGKLFFIRCKLFMSDNTMRYYLIGANSTSQFQLIMLQLFLLKFDTIEMDIPGVKFICMDGSEKLSISFSRAALLGDGGWVSLSPVPLWLVTTG